MVQISNTNSRESSVQSVDVIIDGVSKTNLHAINGDGSNEADNMEEDPLNVSVVGSTTSTSFKRFVVPASVQPQRRKKNRKRTRNQMQNSTAPIVEENGEEDAERVTKKPKLVKNQVK